MLGTSSVQRLSVSGRMWEPSSSHPPIHYTKTPSLLAMYQAEELTVYNIAVKCPRQRTKSYLSWKANRGGWTK